MKPEIVTFTKHALRRARERKLWKFVNKKKFFFDATYLAPDKSKLENCIYVSRYEEDKIKILTLYPIL